MAEPGAGREGRPRTLRGAPRIATRQVLHTATAGTSHTAATHLGEQKVGLGLFMAKTRHRNPRTAMRYVHPGVGAVAEVTELLDTAPRRSG